MPRTRKTGAVYPIKYETSKRLANGKVRKYTGYHARIDGKWVSGRTYAECDAKIKTALDERGRWGMSSNRSVTIGEYASEWYEGYKQTLDPNTRRGYLAIINGHISKYAGRKVADFTPTLIRRTIDRMTLKDGSPASVGSRQCYHKVLRLIFKSAVADRIIPTNPVDGVPRPKGKDESLTKVRPHNAYTVEQLTAMLGASSDDLRTGAIQWWRILTGMRQMEILGAVLDDLTLEQVGPDTWEGYYTVNWQLSYVRRLHGCGKADGRGVYPCGWKNGSCCPKGVWDTPPGFDMIPLLGTLCLTPPKTRTGRVVPIIPPLGTVMHRYLELVKDEPNPFGLIFHDVNGSPLDKKKDLEGFRRLLAKAGVPHPEKRYGHECRNSVVSLLFSMGVDPGKIQRIVGHSSLQMSEYYRRVPKEELLAGMETLGDKLDLKQIEWKTE